MVRETRSSVEKMNLIDHLKEVRRRLFWSVGLFFLSFLGSYPFSAELYAFLTLPLQEAMDIYGGSQRLIYTGLTETFLTYIRLSFFCGFLVSFPFFAVQFWLFVAPGLYNVERRIFKPYLFFIPVLFIMGIVFAYFVVIPLTYQFLLSFQDLSVYKGLNIELEARVSEYLSLTIRMMVAFGVSFQIPIMVFLSIRFGIFSYESLSKGRKFVIVGIFIFAAMITPPDVLTQILLAIPLMVLYELGLFFSKDVFVCENLAASVLPKDIFFTPDETDYNEGLRSSLDA